jgi:hypothetical protein
MCVTEPLFLELDFAATFEILSRTYPTAALDPATGAFSGSDCWCLGTVLMNGIWLSLVKWEVPAGIKKPTPPVWNGLDVGCYLSRSLPRSGLAASCPTYFLAQNGQSAQARGEASDKESRCKRCRLHHQGLVFRLLA